MLVSLNGKERKTNINDVKPYSTSELIENAWDSFLDSIKIILKTSELDLNFEQTMY